MEDLFKVIGAALFFFAVVVGASVLGAYPTKWLVNYVLSPEAIAAVFGTAQIGLWKALWTNVLCGFLFKSSSTSTSKGK